MTENWLQRNRNTATKNKNNKTGVFPWMDSGPGGSDFSSLAETALGGDTYACLAAQDCWAGFTCCHVKFSNSMQNVPKEPGWCPGKGSALAEFHF